jgi:alpha-glucosidase
LSARPWLPVPPGYEKVNVRSELTDSESLLNWHRKLIALRRGDPALRAGRLVMLDASNPHVLSYARVTADGSGIVIALNMSAQTQTVSLNTAGAGLAGSRWRTLLSSPAEIATDARGRLTLPPFAAWMAGIE